jgi:hypothetical protein
MTLHNLFGAEGGRRGRVGRVGQKAEQTTGPSWAGKARGAERPNRPVGLLDRLGRNLKRKAFRNKN